MADQEKNVWTIYSCPECNYAETMPSGSGCMFDGKIDGVQVVSLAYVIDALERRAEDCEELEQLPRVHELRNLAAWFRSLTPTSTEKDRL